MIDTFWYRPAEGFNLGDEVTAQVLANLFEVPFQRAPFPKAKLISTGSTLTIAWDRPEHAVRTLPMRVVGSGFMYQA